MMASKTIELSILRPDWSTGATGQAVQGFTQLHSLSHAPGLYLAPRIVLFGHFPVRRHGGGENTEFESEVRVSGGNHFMVNEFICCSQMACKTFFGTLVQVAGVIHTQLQRLFMRPVSGGVRTQPARSRTVAGFAAYAVIERKGLRTLISTHVKRVTDQTFRRPVGRTEIEDFANTKGNWIAKHAESTRVSVLRDPNAVLILINTSRGPWLNASVAAACCASAGTTVFTGKRDLLSVERLSSRRGGC